MFEDSTENLVDEGATNIEQKDRHSDEHGIRHNEEIYAVSKIQSTALSSVNINPVSKISYSIRAANELTKSGI